MINKRELESRLKIPLLTIGVTLALWIGNGCPEKRGYNPDDYFPPGAVQRAYENDSTNFQNYNLTGESRENDRTK